MQVVEELILLGKIACPMAISSLVLHSKSIISMLFLGHLGDIELAGGSLAIGFANITGYSVIKGLAMGMEPICCQAYGAKKWSILSQTYKKTLCILFLATIPISLLWLYMEPILLGFGQDQNITSIARVYITYSIPELLSQAHLHPLRIFIRIQNLTKPIAIVVIFSMILHFPINYLLVIHLNLGVKGVALASFWYTINLSLGLLAYLILSRTAMKPWKNLHVTSFFQGWQPLVSLMLPSVLSVCLEWWWYEIMLLLCGLQDNPQASVAAMGILIQTTGLLYVVPYSLNLGLSARVGQELGAGQPSQAKRATTVGLIVSIFCGLLAFVFTVSVKDWWGKMYTKEQQILDLISLVLPIVGVCELGNCPQTAACGVLIGSARPKVGACVNFVAFYLIGLPVSTLLAFKLKLGVMGLWFGLAASQASCVCLMIYVLVCTDWKYQAQRAKELTQLTDEDGNNDLEANLLYSTN
ncbi:protein DETOXIFICATION 53 [Manihot esculenta]|uniref:protein DETOXIFICATION 53 n=1 Tax=Manihot esculenta TaxID=3983 RepID=UPI000B5D0941|nr:protein DETOXIFICATION 53 [Manihot esculenta]